jgi:DNA-binding MarR family transcriptional regulator
MATKRMGPAAGHGVMSRPNKKQQLFAPFPLRALSDPRLGAQHLRVLGIVAAFDRLGKNGNGCWAAQNTIAEIARIDKTRVSHSLSDLRDFGYISSEMNPNRRWFRVHRVIYTAEDSRFWEADKSVAPHDNCLGKSVAESQPISCALEQNQLRGTTEKTKQISDLQNVTIVRTITRTKGESAGGFLEGQNCAEARSRSENPSEAEQYLEECEALTTSSDRNLLQFERSRLERIAGDPCLCETLNERAARLLSEL